MPKHIQDKVYKPKPSELVGEKVIEFQHVPSDREIEGDEEIVSDHE